MFALCVCFVWLLLCSQPLYYILTNPTTTATPETPPPTHTHKQNHPQTPQPPPPPPPQDVLERISVCARVLLDPESLLLVKDTLLSKCRESFAAFLRFKNGGLWRVCV